MEELLDALANLNVNAEARNLHSVARVLTFLSHAHIYAMQYREIPTKCAGFNYSGATGLIMRSARKVMRSYLRTTWWTWR